MVLFLRELDRNKKYFIIWTISLVGSSILMMMLFPYMEKNMSDLVGSMMTSMPEGMINALNLQLDFSKVLPFFAYLFQYILLFSSIYAMQFGAGILSREEGEKTVEFLMAKPVTRTGIITSKLSCLIFYLLVFNVIFTVSDYIAFVAITKQEFSIQLFLLMHLGQLFLQLVFAMLGLFISVFVTKTATIFPLTIGIVLGMYFISIVSGISEELEKLKYITPFEYMNPADMIQTEQIEPVYIMIICAVTLISAVGTYVFYNKKDIMA